MTRDPSAQHQARALAPSKSSDVCVISRSPCGYKRLYTGLSLSVDTLKRNAEVDLPFDRFGVS